ncbi:MAG: bifunctional adenosylcobinamide kinase/adenosylcobinamide-phosphate guanylyltransferase [Agathobacter sp.]|nr:bifunctional adenosylcobinamide kinase/adenosylcobinamide-phosphate guanylyltransferase [Agathobacter sp.]
MKLVIGGYAQGKLCYVLQKTGEADCMIYDASLPDDTQQKEAEESNRILVVNHLHKWIREMLTAGKEPEQLLFPFLRKNQNCIVICDEIGNGIVPIDPLEREYRERTGRILIEIAKQADEVVRIICGIGQKIK